MGTVAALPGISKLSSSDLKALENAAKAIGIPVDWLATVISFETGGTFSPSVLNKAGSGAFGLIQFLPKTAASLLGHAQTAAGRADAAHEGSQMSFSEQLEKMVIPYFKWFNTPRNLNDTYLAVFYPSAMGKKDDHVVITAPSIAYDQNSGFDKTGKGYITRADITRAINNLYNIASNTRIKISGNIMQVIGGLFAAGIIYLAWRNKETLEKEFNTRIRPELVKIKPELLKWKSRII